MDHLILSEEHKHNNITVGGGGTNLIPSSDHVQTQIHIDEDLHSRQLAVYGRGDYQMPSWCKCSHLWASRPWG